MFNLRRINNSEELREPHVDGGPSLVDGRRALAAKDVRFEEAHEAGGPRIRVEQVLSGSGLGHAVVVEASRPLGAGAICRQERRVYCRVN